jgi:hypothetical protein
MQALPGCELVVLLLLHAASDNASSCQKQQGCGNSSSRLPHTGLQPTPLALCCTVHCPPPRTIASFSMPNHTPAYAQQFCHLCITQAPHTHSKLLTFATPCEHLPWITRGSCLPACMAMQLRNLYTTHTSHTCFSRTCTSGRLNHPLFPTPLFIQTPAADHG